MLELLENESRKDYYIRCRRPEVEFFVCGYCGFTHEPELENGNESRGLDNDMSTLFQREEL